MKLPSLQNILLGSHFLGIEHCMFEKKEMSSIVLIERKEDELTISHTETNNFTDETSSRINKKTPTYLTINTNQILYKTVESVSDEQEKILISAFPNLKKEDFYYEVWTYKTFSIVALARKNYIDKILKEYQELGFSICGIRLGICALSEIITYIEKDQFFTNTQFIDFNNPDCLISNKSENKFHHYNINGLTVKNTQLLAFSGALNFFNPNKKLKGNIHSKNVFLKDIYVQESFFKKGLLLLLGILLFLLLTNFFIFDHYYSKVSEQNETITLNNTTINNIYHLKKRVDDKERQARSMLYSNNFNSSIKINEIVKSVPNSILLSNLELNPLKKNIKKNEEILVEANEITLSGITNDNNEFTKWIDHLKKIKFTDSIIIKQFGKYENMETTFSIRLKLK